MIDQYQRLFFIHPYQPQRLALPASLFDQPAGSQFDAAIGLHIGGQAGMRGQQRVRLLTVDHRIVEKTAGVGEHRRVVRCQTELGIKWIATG